MSCDRSTVTWATCVPFARTSSACTASFGRPKLGRPTRSPPLRARLDALREVVFESTLPTQALHGDVSLGNLLHTPQRLIWNDFEDTFPGPVHWDLAGYAISLRAHGASSRFVRRMLNAYR